MLNKNKYIKQTLLSVVTIIAITGCSAKQESTHGGFNKKFQEFTSEEFNATQAPDYVKDSIKEISNNKRHINLDNVKRLSIVLEHLANIDGKSYILSRDSEDIFLQPIKESHKLGLDSFDKLNQYIQDTSNYEIYVKKNRFLKDRVKIVAVKNKDIYKKDLSSVPFTLEGKSSVADVVEQLRIVTGFNVIAKDIPQVDTEEGAQTSQLESQRLFTNNSVSELFENNYISFSGNNIMELLNYISNSFNIYVDVDYDNKLIVFRKLKSKMFSINLNNIEYSGSLDVKKKIDNDVGSGGGEEKSIKTKVKLDILDSLDNSINAILDSVGQHNGVYTFNKTVGSIFVKADKQTMQEIALLVDNFNNVFSKQLDFQLEIYEFAVTKKFDIGIDLLSTLNTSNYTGSILTNYVADSVLSAAHDSSGAVPITRSQEVDGEFVSSSSTTKRKGDANIDNQTIQLLKQTRHGYIIKNSIPYYIDVTDSKSYVQSINRETDTETNIVTETPITSEINEGTVLSVLSKINGNSIELNIQPKIVKLNGVSEQVVGENTITLPDLTTNTFTSNIVIKDGEKKVIGYITSYEDANEYNGIVPIDNFILGGSRSKKFFRKETVYVISAKIR